MFSFVFCKTSAHREPFHTPSLRSRATAPGEIVPSLSRSLTRISPLGEQRARLETSHWLSIDHRVHTSNKCFLLFKSITFSFCRVHLILKTFKVEVYCSMFTTAKTIPKKVPKNTLSRMVVTVTRYFADNYWSSDGSISVCVVLLRAIISPCVDSWTSLTISWKLSTIFSGKCIYAWNILHT